MTLKQLLLCSSLFLLACSGSKYTPADFPNDSIVFGYGGGVANISTEYHLLENGNLFKKGLEQDFISIKKVNSNTTKQLFNNIEFLEIENIELTDPGNKTNFLIINKNAAVHEITWGGNKMVPSEKLKLFYSTLMNLVNQEK